MLAANGSFAEHHAEDQKAVLITGASTGIGRHATETLDVNVFGVISVTQAFATIIMESKGRITTIGSIAETGAWVGGSDYTMSKHAIEAFSDVLGLEMARFDVRASGQKPIQGPQ